MTLDKHVNAICKSFFYHLRNIARVRRYLSLESTKTLVHALVTSGLDSDNALLFGLPDYLIQRLHYVLHSGARLVTLTRKFDHVTPILINLHWLPVQQRIILKILLYTYKSFNGLTPTYLSDLISPYMPRRALRSADQLLLQQPTYKLKSYGSRAFSVCAPKLWNSLPLEIKSSSSVPVFKCNLKTYLFRLAYF